MWMVKTDQTGWLPRLTQNLNHWFCNKKIVTFYGYFRRLKDDNTEKSHIFTSHNYLRFSYFESNKVNYKQGLSHKAREAL